MAKTATAPAPVEAEPTLVALVEMTKTKETPGAVKYDDATDGSVVPTLYVRKDAFEGDVYPEKITVTVAF